MTALLNATGIDEFDASLHSNLLSRTLDKLAYLSYREKFAQGVWHAKK